MRGRRSELSRSGRKLNIQYFANANLTMPACLYGDVLSTACLFLWGGAFVGIYTTVAMLGDKDAELIGIYTSLSIACGVGALLGPLIGGMAMESSPHGLPVFATIACGGFALFAGFNEDRDRDR
jgi:hypothetical protein